MFMNVLIIYNLFHQDQVILDITNQKYFESMILVNNLKLEYDEKQGIIYFDTSKKIYCRIIT